MMIIVITIIALIVLGSVEFIYKVLCRNFVKSKKGRILAGLAPSLFACALIIPWISNVRFSLWLLISSLPILYLVVRGFFFMKEGLYIKSINAKVIGWDGSRVNLLIENADEFLGIDEGFFYVYGNRIGRKPIYVSRYEFSKFPKDIKLKWIKNGFILSFKSPKPFVSGFFNGIEGLVVARCVRIKVRGNTIYLCPPVSSVEIDVERSLRIDTPKGKATLSIGVDGSEINMILETELDAEVYIVRRNSLTGHVKSEKIIRGRWGRYTARWRPKISKDFLIITEEDLPHRILKCSDVTSEVNDIRIALCVKDGNRKHVKMSRIVIKEGYAKRFWKIPVQK